MTHATDKILILIPARLQSERLPEKPLKDINGDPMIVHVWRRAIEADLGPVVIATDSEEIKKVAASAGAEVVMTARDHQSGSDRIFEALEKFDAEGSFAKIINLQGDLPTIEPATIKSCAALLGDPATEISTLAVEIRDEAEKTDPNVVKMIGTKLGRDHYRALYFTRATAPAGEGPLFHHIGIYAYQRSALERFINLPASELERREKLEQLRAIESGMRIDVAIVNAAPIGVDTEADLANARAHLTAISENETSP